MVAPQRLRTLLACLAVTLTVTFLGAARAETVLLEFSSQFCGPCRSMQPIVDRLSAEGLHVEHVDVSARPEVARQFHVDSWPTFVALVDGREQARLVGATNREELVQMVEQATVLARHASNANPNGAVVSPVGFGGRSQPFGRPTTFADGAAGPIVDLQHPDRNGPTGSPAAAKVAASSNAGGSVPAVALIPATVRLSVSDPDGKSTGTGTIVDARNGEALVVTCGHLFRSSNGKGAIEVTTFASGPSGAVASGTAAGRLVHFDLERDLAMVSFKPPASISVAPVAPAGKPLVAGDAVTAVGCNHGDNPTPWTTKITALNRYQGFPNVEAAGAPVEGRSGGGLFNAEGQLVGVCFAAEPKEDEGLYASLPSIQAKLDAVGLAKIYQAPQGVGGVAPSASAAATQLADAGRPPVMRGQDPASSDGVDPLASAPPVGSTPFERGPSEAPLHVATVTPAAAESPMPPVAPAPASVALSAAEQATLQELQRRGAQAEVICIIHAADGQGPSEVIKLNAASPALVAALRASAATPAGIVSPAVATAPAGNSWTR